MKQIISALRDCVALSLPYFRSEDRWRAWALLVAVIGAELGLAYVLVATNQWNGRFFNALEARDWDAFRRELVVFVAIACGAILAGVAQYYAGQTLQIRWRRWMTEHYVARWMADGRHYRVRQVAPQVDNIHLHIASDTYIYIQRTHELFTGLLGSIVALVSFSYILWGISAMTPLTLFGIDFAVPGYLIWTAILYAGIGTVIAHWIGWRLTPLNFNQQRFESDFRFAIVRAADHSEPVALMRGEAVERTELGRRFGNLVRNWTSLVNRQSRLVGFTAGYANVSTVFPTLVVSPAFLAGAIPLGTLIQAALAFQKVEGAFAFCVSSYSKLAEWRAIMDRLTQFEASMDAVDADRHRPDCISIAAEAGDGVDVRDLVVRLPDGQAIADIAKLSLHPGERALITGASGSGKSSVFRALAGLWSTGTGHVTIPRHADILVMPQRPYFPLGTLREAIAYPRPAGELAAAAIARAMHAVGLEHLIERLDEEGDWDVVLSGGEQQRVALARALLCAPDVLLLDEPVATLEESAGRTLYRTLMERLPNAIMLSIDRRGVLREFHQRTIEMASPVPRHPRLAAATA